MKFKVKEDARWQEYAALGGMTFTKKSAVEVPADQVDAAMKLPFLEPVDEVVEQYAEAAAEVMHVDLEVEEPIAHEVKPSRRSAKKKEG